jgi:3-methyladenine DNA glycosylase Mpg
MLRGSKVYAYEDSLTERIRAADVIQTPRIGLGLGKGDDLPWRWVKAGHPHASRKS